MRIRSLLSFVIASTLLVNFVDAAIPQLEMRLLGGRCPLPTGTIKLFVLLLLLISLLVLKIRLDPHRSTFIYANVFLAYLLFEVIYLSGLYPFSYVIFSFENYYFYMFLIPFFFVLRPAVAPAFWHVTLYVLTILLAGLGFWQGYTNSPIVRVGSTNGNFLVHSFTFFGHIRAFSLFGNSGTFGNFLSISGAFMVIILGRRTGYLVKMTALALLCFVGLVVTMTLSRSVYYEFILSIVTAILLSLRTGYLVRQIPLVYGFLGVILAFIIPTLQVVFGRTLLGFPLLDDTTQQMRMVEWVNTWDQIVYTPTSFFLGTGTIQSTQYANVFSGSIDNMFLAVMLHIGFIGLAFYLIIMGNLWRICLDVARRSKNAVSLALISTFSTWMILGMFTIQPTGFPLIFLIALMSSGVYARAGASRSARRSAEGEAVTAAA